MFLKKYHLQFSLPLALLCPALESQGYPKPCHLCGQCQSIPRCLTCLSVTPLIAAVNEMLMSLKGYLGVNHPVAGAICTRLTYFLPVPLPVWKSKVENMDKHFAHMHMQKNDCIHKHTYMHTSANGAKRISLLGDNV